MISRQSDVPSMDFLLLEKHLKDQDPDVKVVVLCRTLNGKLSASFVVLLRYGFHMLRQMYHMATAKVVVLDSYCIAASLFKHKKELQIIQMWHSVGSMKKFGYDVIDTEEGSPSDIANLLQMHKNYTCVFAASEVYVEDLASGFSCDKEIVKVMPLPRVDLLRSDVYAQKKQQQILENYPQIIDKKVILYAPTFRQDESQFEEAVIDLIKEIDVSKEILVVSLHPLSKVSISGIEGVLSNGKFSSFDWIFVADAMITDYSCIAYEAAFYGIPLYFYDFDMDDYLNKRGMAIDYYAEIPGPAEKDPAMLMSRMRTEKYDIERLREFSDKYICYDGHAGQDIAEYILGFM